MNQSTRTRLQSIWLCALGLLGLLGLSGCGDGATGGNDPGVNLQVVDMGMPYQTAFPPIAPQVTAGSGTVLSSPKVVPVFFRGDVQTNGTLLTNLTTAMQSYLATSTSWAVMQEYGVGRGTVAPPVTLTTTPAATVTDAEIQALVSTSIQNGTFPKNDANTVYAIYYPAAVTITRSGLTSCVDFEGYHYYVTQSDGSRVPYLVVPRCKGATLALLTVITSHELTEAASDPFVTSYNLLSDPYAMWLFALNGTEIADLCENLNDFLYSDPIAGAVSKVFSNRAAANHKNPCLPTTATQDFFAVPIFNTLLPIVINGRPSSAEVVTIRAGQSGTVPVRFYSPSSPSPTWSVTATEYPLPDASGKPNPKALTMTWQQAPTQSAVQGTNGSQVQLQIAVSATTTAGFTTFRLTSTGPGAAAPQTMWVGAVQILR